LARFRQPGRLTHDFAVVLAAFAGEQREQCKDAGIARGFEGQRR
jgi:hypothetical protein